MAAATGIAVNCYWNGQVRKENYDVIFEGDNINVTPIKLELGTTYAELLDKTYKITGIERRDFDLNIICRYPISSREYKPIPIKNDEAVEVMLEVPSRSGMYCVEIFLEKQPSMLNLLGLTLEGNEVNEGHGVADKIESKNANGESFIRPYGEGPSDFCKPLSLSCSGGKHGETSSKRLMDFARREEEQAPMEGGRKWEELNQDCLANVFQRVGMESLLLDIPFVCKSWNKVRQNPKCWELLIFPKKIKPEDIWDDDHFTDRLNMEYGGNFSVSAFIKFVIDRSHGCATALKLPNGCTEEALEYAANKCPLLKALGLPADLLYKQSTIISRLINKWKDLEALSLGSRDHMKEILAQISLHCRNFISLSSPQTYIEKDEASAIVTLMPNIKYLSLRGATMDRKNLVMILQGCKELVSLDVRDCTGFDEDDAEILELASHIHAFKCKGSCLYDYTDEYEMSHISHDDCVYDCDYYFD